MREVPSGQYSYYLPGFYPTWTAPVAWDAAQAPNVGVRVGVKTASIDGRRKVVHIPARRKKAVYKPSPAS